MPDIELLAGATVGPLPVDEFLTRLNEEISKVAGRDKQLGHAYFLEDGQPVSDSDRFAQIFRQDIVPLLQEYCYDDYKRLTELLGERLAPPDAQRLNSDVLGDAPALLDALHSRFVSEPD
jgi:5-methylcytosine-specific restriction protein B